jgi:hypothetical protein
MTSDEIHFGSIDEGRHITVNERKGVMPVASKTKQTWLIRDRKHRSNTVNLKKQLKRLGKNLEVLASLSASK